MATYRPFPRLRPVEVFPAEQDGREVLVVLDPTGQALGPLAVSPAALVILSLLDGSHGSEEIQEAFRQQVGRTLPMEQLMAMVDQLDAAHYLDSERYRSFLESQKEAYNAAPTRRSGDAVTLGAGTDGLGFTLTKLLGGNERVRPSHTGGRIAGLVAPHLDYVRGQCCYADVYGLLAETDRPPRRVVILGTNHFGQATSVVVTGKDFETPLGITRTDRGFLTELEHRCGRNLTGEEYDHQREHSVELQVVMLQHILGPEQFEIVPILCPDPTGPTGTQPADGEGVDLHEFAEQLGQMVTESGDETIVVAGADLSHVGGRFGDDHELDKGFLGKVEVVDRQALEAVVSSEPSVFLKTLAGHGNSTRICSVGCLYALMTALRWAKPEILRYHQAVDGENGMGVTCASMVFWKD